MEISEIFPIEWPKNVIIGCPSVVHNKIRQLAIAGPDKLAVISDFDRTLSKFEDNEGERCWTTHEVFDHFGDLKCPGLGDKFTALRKKYLPIEYDPHLIIEEKIPHMREWWSLTHHCMTEVRFSRTEIIDYVKRSRIFLRDGAADLFQKLEAAAVPVLVFSAGLSDVISMKLNQEFGRDFENMRIIGNAMDFDENGVVTGFREPLIHSFNKDAEILSRIDGVRDYLGRRKNIILMGDSLGDPNMSTGLETDGITLKIGFLNEQKEKLLPEYSAVNDIVIIEDQTMKVPQLIIDTVLAKRTESAISVRSA